MRVSCRPAVAHGNDPKSISRWRAAGVQVRHIRPSVATIETCSQGHREAKPAMPITISYSRYGGGKARPGQAWFVIAGLHPRDCSAADLSRLVLSPGPFIDVGAGIRDSVSRRWRCSRRRRELSSSLERRLFVFVVRSTSGGSDSNIDARTRADISVEADDGSEYIAGRRPSCSLLMLVLAPALYCCC